MRGSLLPWLVACWLGAAGSLFGAGCASSSPSGTERSDDERAVAKSRNRVRKGVEAAFRDSESRGPYTHPVRSNPARCESPTYEVYAHGRWTRVHLDHNSEQQERLESLTRESDGVGPRARPTVRGRWAGRRKASNGLKYPVFRVEEIEAP